MYRKKFPDEFLKKKLSSFFVSTEKKFGNLHKIPKEFLRHNVYRLSEYFMKVVYSTKSKRITQFEKKSCLAILV